MLPPEQFSKAEPSVTNRGFIRSLGIEVVDQQEVHVPEHTAYHHTLGTSSECIFTTGVAFVYRGRALVSCKGCLMVWQ